MKSEPGRPSVRTSSDAGTVSVSAASAPAGRASSGRRAVVLCCALVVGLATSVAAPAAAPFRKPRRLSRLFLESFTGVSSFQMERVYLARAPSQTRSMNSQEDSVIEIIDHLTEWCVG